jgi:hypothetical protein
MSMWPIHPYPTGLPSKLFLTTLPNLLLLKQNTLCHHIHFLLSMYHNVKSSFLLLRLEFELRALCLQSRHSTTWLTPTVHFALDILEMGVLRTICPGYPWTMILWVSASQVDRITGMSHQIILIVHLNAYLFDVDTLLPTLVWLGAPWEVELLEVLFIAPEQNLPLS